MDPLNYCRCSSTGLGSFAELTPDIHAEEQGLWWLDVTPGAHGPDLLNSLAGLEVALEQSTIEALLSDRDRPEPHLAHICSREGMLRFWAFGATVEKHTGDDGMERVAAVSIQSVALLVSDWFVLTCRHPGLRFPIGDVDIPVTDSEPLGVIRLRDAAGVSLALLSRDATGIDRDLLLFAMLGGLVATLFDARATLGNAKIRYDEWYFEELIRSRKEAATADTTSSAVALVVQRAAELTDETRRALASIQRIASPFRQWFEDLKPPGLPDKRAVWLPHTTQPAASEHIVDRIYQVRNDLQAVRREVHQSMGLLIAADTGGQLLAVRALLDRTESARGAVVAAGSITVLLASLGLSAAVATIPHSGAHFQPLARALLDTGVAVLAVVLVGIAMALLSRRQPPARRNTWRAAGCISFLLATSSLIVALFSSNDRLPLLLGVGGAFGVLALLIVAYIGDYGSKLHVGTGPTPHREAGIEGTGAKSKGSAFARHRAAPWESLEHEA
jgi:hypothetical protein